MKQKIYQADAFTGKLFGGNPAAICPLDKWLSDDLMQQIAMENNLAETAFYVKKNDQYELRWFTPVSEVDLCGHATLAAAFVLFNCEGHDGDDIQFHSPRSGPLSVTKNGKVLTLNFPTDVYEEVELTKELTDGFNILPQTAFLGKADYMLVYNNEEEIMKLQPDYRIIALLKSRGVIVTAQGNETDFVSRYFAPAFGIDEDPVTGSAHTMLTPYWAGRLEKNSLSAIQLSKRKGYLQCTYLGERVEISGEARLYMVGEIFLNEPD